MISNKAMYPTLTWPQLTIRLIMGLAVLFANSRPERMPPKRRSRRAGIQKFTNIRNLKAVARPAQDKTDASIVASVLRAAYYTLGILAASREPLFFGCIVQKLRAAQKARNDSDLLTPIVIRDTIDRLVSHANVRLGRRGFTITDSGMKLFTRVARIHERAVLQRRQHARVRLPAAQGSESAGARLQRGLHSWPPTQREDADEDVPAFNGLGEVRRGIPQPV